MGIELTLLGPSVRDIASTLQTTSLFVPQAAGAAVIVGACGVCCNVCRLFVSGVCTGCARGASVSSDQVSESACAILRCTTSRGIAFCTRDCSDHPCELYRHSLPVCEREAAAPPSPQNQVVPDWMLASHDAGQRRPPGQTEPGARLYVFCLGPLRVQRDGREIDEAEWGRTKGPTQKVKALFAYLLAKDGRGATKDEIVELLWGDTPASEKNDARLHAALYYLRRALEPELPTRTESHFIRFQDGFYKLIPPGGLWVDAAAFEAYFKRAQDLETGGHSDMAVRFWKLAESLYQGDYMAGLPPCYTEDYVDDCCQWRRYRLKDMHTTALLRLAQHHYRANEDGLSLVCAQKALAEDRCCEEAHCLIMKLKHRAGQFGDLTRQYRLCERLLRAAEDRRPSPETIQLYQRLLQTRSPENLSQT